MAARASATPVYLGLGANLGDREASLRRALDMLAERGCQVLAVSPLYETEPWGVLDQPRFLNAACLVETALPPHRLLDTLLEVEVALGRVRTQRYGPRSIDLDILMYGELRIRTARLTVPHPGMLERATVLAPLADIALSVEHPESGRPIAYHLRALGALDGVASYPPGLSATDGQGSTSSSLSHV